MTATMPPGTPSSQPDPPKLEQAQQTQEPQAKAGPRPIEPLKTGRKPLFRR